MRCQRCTQITVADIRGCEILQQPSFMALKSSAESGCDLCELSYVAIMSDYSHAMTRFENEDVSVIEMLSRGQNPMRNGKHDTAVFIEGELNDYQPCNRFNEKAEKVSVRIGSPLSGENSPIVFLKVGVDPESILTKYITGRMPSQYPGDPTTMAKVKDWIETCDQKHKDCVVLSEDRPLPKRILDIKDQPVVRFTDSAEGRYVALSYCWGTSGANVLLTHFTIDRFTSTGIDLGTLPRTIQDAIIVCRALGLYYLWIDALCIIQGEHDYKDFIAEAPRMCDYYRNAYLTLIAGSAQDCAEGFLDKPRISEMRPCELVYDRTFSSLDRDMTGSVKVFIAPSHNRGPIQERAWTFQEASLSQRSIVYGVEQIHFTCPMYQIHEDGGFYKIPAPDEPQPFIPSGLPINHRLIAHNNKAKALDQAYRLWFAVIYNYTLRKLSDPLDKLAAIAGYANHVQQIVQCRYMYGLWANALAKGLLWTPQRPWNATKKTGAVMRAPDRAPSWSWASIDGPILYTFAHTPRKQFEDPKSFQLDVLSCDKVPSSFDPVRSVANLPEAFELVVRGSLQGVWHVSTLSGASKEFTLWTSQHDQAQGHVAMGSWDTYDDYESKTYCDQLLYALLVMPQNGLLLTQVDDKHYRRVGQFWKTKEGLFNNISPKEVVLM